MNSFFFKRDIDGPIGGSADGFTLVELMVVVAIIGILSSVAIPSFKQYQAKAKTSEAKLQLSSIYSAETSLQADYDSFATCLEDMGYTRMNKGYYVLGFKNTSAANSNVTANGASKCDSSESLTPLQHIKVDGVVSVKGDLKGYPVKIGNETKTLEPEVPANGDKFLVQAVGIIQSGMKGVAGRDKDVWQVDENKNMSNPQKGY